VPIEVGREPPNPIRGAMSNPITEMRRAGSQILDLSSREIP